MSSIIIIIIIHALCSEVKTAPMITMTVTAIDGLLLLVEMDALLTCLIARLTYTVCT